MRPYGGFALSLPPQTSVRDESVLALEKPLGPDGWCNSGYQQWSLAYVR